MRTIANSHHDRIMNVNRSILLPLAALACTGALAATSLSGVVKDPSGAVVAGAAVSAENSAAKSSLHAVTDPQGRFRFETLAAGSWLVGVMHEGFERWERRISVADKPIDFAISLKLKSVTTSVEVSGKRSVLANSDPNYRALRGGKLTKVYQVQNLALTRDAGVFTFRSGSFSFLPPVMGHVTTGVFVGDGNFRLQPASEVAVKHLHRIAGLDAIDEDFGALVIYFSDGTFDEIRQHSELADDSLQRHEDALKRIKETLQHRREPPSPMLRFARPLSFLERLLNYEDVPNMEAEVLAELYNRGAGSQEQADRSGSFRAFIHGKKNSDLRFLMNPTGALATLAAPEETALINFDPVGDNDGIWYLSHLLTEVHSGRASSSEDKRLIAPTHYKMDIGIRGDNIIGQDAGIAVTCDLEFRALRDGTRMVKFDLTPDLQVSRVAWNGKEIPFIQESRKQDGSFYLQMPAALVKDSAYRITLDYSGGEIIRSDFGMVPTRRVWYPKPAGQASRSTYDLVFRSPHGTKVVAVGKPVKQERDGAFDVSEWSSEVPIQVATFRYFRDYFTKTRTDEPTGTQMDVYMDAEGRGFTPPSRGDILIDAGNSLRVFNAWFGPPSFDYLSVVVGAGTDSMPGLVYASPVTVAGYSSLNTQMIVRTMGRGPSTAPGIPGTFRTYLDEAFPREIARQWWGNTISPISFHDNWLALGFANFSTSLYDLAAYLKPDDFREHWTRARESIINTNRFGVRPNDAGPVWMGLVNDSFKTPGVGALLSTYKGGYILHMLRCLMFDPATQDKDFRDMMQDYVKTLSNQSVSTEDFKWMVEKHMKPAMDADGNRRMDWFFNEWVYGTEVPSYHLEYSIATEKGAKPVLNAKLTQSGVSVRFKMPVPVYAELEGKKLLIGSMLMNGNSTGEFRAKLPETPKRILLNANHDVLTDKEEVKQVR
jgi:hypothetical protein